MYIKIGKASAKRFLEDGFTVRLLPNKLRLANVWFLPAEITWQSLADDMISFEGFVNEYESRNCNSEVGRNVAFYLYGDFTMGGVTDRTVPYAEALDLYLKCQREAKDFANNF